MEWRLTRQLHSEQIKIERLRSARDPQIARWLQRSLDTVRRRDLSTLPGTRVPLPSARFECSISTSGYSAGGPLSNAFDARHARCALLKRPCSCRAGRSAGSSPNGHLARRSAVNRFHDVAIDQPGACGRASRQGSYDRPVTKFLGDNDAAFPVRPPRDPGSA